MSRILILFAQCCSLWFPCDRLAELGDEPLRISSAYNYMCTTARFGDRCWKHTTLAAYLRDEDRFGSVRGRLARPADAAHYFFQNVEALAAPWPALLAPYERPALLRGGLRFGVGGFLSGAPFHRHQAVFLDVLVGAKLFFLYPPAADVEGAAWKTIDVENPVAWRLQVYPALPRWRNATAGGLEADAATRRPWECAVSAGDVGYIPPGWWHATLNLKRHTAFMSSWGSGFLTEEEREFFDEQ